MKLNKTDTSRKSTESHPKTPSVIWIPLKDSEVKHFQILGDPSNYLVDFLASSDSELEGAF